MRLGGRLQAAIEVLEEIEGRRRPAADALKDWGLSHRFAGAGDRAAIGNIVYDVLRRRLSLQWRMDSEVVSDAAFGALLDDGGMTVDELSYTFADDRFAPTFLDENQIKAWQQRKLEQAPEHVQADCPLWCVPSFQASFSEHWINEISAMASRPPLDLRVNFLRANKDRVLKELGASGAVAVEWYDEALRIAPIKGLGRHPNVQAEPAFQKGWFEIQDLGSQVVAYLCDATAGQQVLDYCAGAGGKTMALASHMDNRGQIHAYDAEKARLAPIFDRLRRAGVRNAQPHANIEELATLEASMDMVVVDAPCTGTGTWRRRPDAKWRLSEGQLEKRVSDQRDVLDKACQYVKKGGRLVYITCSLLREENDMQLMDFLARHKDFAPVDMKGLWQHKMHSNAPFPFFCSHGLVLSPRQTGTDGFFIAVVEKKS